MMALGIPVRSTPPRGQAFMLLLSLVVVALVATGGALATIEAQPFYAALQKPAWAPPPSVFGPVWTTLYLMMALAAWLVWRSAGGFRQAQTAFTLYGLQLLLNLGWSWLFFRWELGLPALVVVSLLWLLVLLVLQLFWLVNRAAALLMLPYQSWLGFATALNASCWQLNPYLLG